MQYFIQSVSKILENFIDSIFFIILNFLIFIFKSILDFKPFNLNFFITYFINDYFLELKLIKLYMKEKNLIYSFIFKNLKFF
jgi:hypothetical protein